MDSDRWGAADGVCAGWASLLLRERLVLGAHGGSKKADEVLLHATQGISSLISVTGLVNVDFADVRTVMQEGGSALMGTGIGRGENRAIEAAQQAIASPLLDNVSVSGATGVLVNITGGADLTLGEVHQINEIIHDAVGEEAEIIFGAVHEPAMQGEIRVTVIATGFDRHQTGSSQPASVNVPQSTMVRGSPVIPLRPPRGNGASRNAIPELQRRPTPASNPAVTPERDRSSPEQDLSDMEIPTFIRRQMD